MSSQVFSIRVNYDLSKQVAFVRVMSQMPKKHVWIAISSNHRFGHDRLTESNIFLYKSSFLLTRSKVEERDCTQGDIRVILNERATAAGIMHRLNWLLDDVKFDDTRLLFYFGHGSQISVYDPTDEADCMDECLVPQDFDWTPHAVTVKQFLNLYSQIPNDSHFAAILDFCHCTLRWNAELQICGGRPLRQPHPCSQKKAVPWVLKAGVAKEDRGKA